MKAWCISQRNIINTGKRWIQNVLITALKFILWLLTTLWALYGTMPRDVSTWCHSCWGPCTGDRNMDQTHPWCDLNKIASHFSITRQQQFLFSNNSNRRLWDTGRCITHRCSSSSRPSNAFLVIDLILFRCRILEIKKRFQWFSLTWLTQNCWVTFYFTLELCEQLLIKAKLIHFTSLSKQLIPVINVRNNFTAK